MIAIPLKSWMAALAIHAKPEDGYHPEVKIFGSGTSLHVSGVEALEKLRQAIDYALEGVKP